MATPRLKKEDVLKIIPNCEVLGKAIRGGQKLVFPCIYAGKKCAIKFILLNEVDSEDEETVAEGADVDEIKSRAERELAIMKNVSSKYLIKMGNINLTQIEYNNQDLLYYSEEWIEGKDVHTLLLLAVTMDIKEVIKMAMDISSAIEEIWITTKNVHRDIKPLNIMRRDLDGSFVLLDLGMAFDLEDKSLTRMGYVPGTKIYFSPEQLDWKRKRDIDFRSDLFSLGIVMYQCLTGCHPFYQGGVTDNELFNRIINETPRQPQAIRDDIPDQVNEIVMRLLNKAPNARYRKCALLRAHLEKCCKREE